MCGVFAFAVLMPTAPGAVIKTTAHALVARPRPAPPTPPLVIVRFERVVSPGGPLGVPSGTIVRAVAELPNGQIRRRDLAIVNARCVEDVGGMETLAVMTCTEESGRVREFVLEEKRRAIVANEYSVRDQGTRRRLVRRFSVTRIVRGWTTVPRCAATFHDPRACMPQN